MILETERLILRPWDESDAEDLFECAKDHRVGPSAGWPVHTSVENSKAIIKTVLAQPQNFAVGLIRIWCGYYEGNEKSKRVQEKCGFIYHHAEEKKLLKLLNEERVEHVSILTKENWEGKNYENFNHPTRRP